MSDLITPQDVELLQNPEYKAAQLRGLLSGLNILPGALTQVLPAGKTEEGDVEPRPPGIVTAPYGFLGGTVPDVANWAGKKAGYDLNIPHAYGADTAQKWYDETSKLAQDVLPVEKLAPAQSEGEQIMHDALRSGGGMLVSIPGTQMAKLPLAARIPASIMAPTTEAAPTVAAIQTAATAGLEGYATDQQNKFAKGIDDILSGAQQPAPQQPTPAAEAASTATPAGQTMPSTFASDVGTILGGGTPDVPAPTFNQQGESNWTVASILGGLAVAAGALAVHGHFSRIGQEVSQAARDARMAEPKYAQAATDFANNQSAARTGAEITKPAQAPLPSGGAVHDAAVAAQTNTLDSSAMIRDYVKLTADNPDVATKLSHQLGLMLNDMSWQGKLRSFLETGEDFQTKLRMPSPERWFNDVGALSAADKERLNSAMLAADELDNRIDMQRKGMSPARYDFYNQSDQDLARIVVEAQRDPVLKELMGRYGEIVRKTIAIGEARKFFTPQETRDINRIHPNYVPGINNEGQVLHALGPRNIAPRAGIAQANTTAWSALAQHLETLYKQYELNEMRSAFIEHQLNVQNTAPGAAQILERVHPAQQTPTLYATVAPSATNYREPIIAVRRGTGPEYYKVNNPHIYDFLSGNNANKFRVNTGALSIPRRWMQSMTTGVGSLLTGRLFPIVNLARTAVQMPINRPRGMVGSASELMVNRLTGGRVNYRGPDPTNLAGAAYAFGRNRLDHAALAFSHVFDPVNPSAPTQILKSLITAPHMQAISDGLKNYYLGTVTHEMQARGLGGMGMPFRTELPAATRPGGVGSASVRLMSGEIAPTLFHSGGKLGAIKPFYINIRDILNNNFAALSDASHEYFYRLNRMHGVDPTTNVYETRALTGDPGTAGKGNVTTVLRGAVPYYNVSLQGLSRQVRALRETPFGTTAAMVSGLGSLAFASIMTAMNHGPGAIQYLQDVLTNQGRAANVTIFGNNPNAPAQYSLPQELRPLYAMMLDIIGKAFNLEAAKSNADAHDGLLGFLKDWFSEHIENSSFSSAMHGIADATNIIDVPPAINSVTALTGNQVRVDLERLVNDWWRGNKSFTEALTMPVGTDKALPNHPPGDSAFEGADFKKYTDIAQNLFGMVGGMLDYLGGFHKYYQQTNSFFDSLGQVGKDWLQAAKDANPGFNSILWENTARQSVRPPIVESVSRQLDAMRVTAGAKTAERYEGTTGGAHPLELPATPSGPSRVPTDPVMRNMYMYVNAQYNMIQSTAMSEINAIKKQMAVQQEQVMDPQAKREYMNEKTREIADKYRYVQALIDDTNANLSALVHKPVTVSTIDWSKGPEQFR